MSYCAAMTMASSTCGALAATSTIQLDLQSLRARSFDLNGMPSPFGGPNHDGSIIFSSGSASALDDVLLNGIPQTIAQGQLSLMNGTIDLLSGNILGGFVHVGLANGNEFFTQITPGVGGVIAAPGQGYSINGLYFDAMFSTNSFGGVDITPFFSAQPLTGSFLSFVFNPILMFNGEGFDGTADLSITLVPSGSAAAALGIGLVGVATRRRRPSH
jgi:hypothetical protein